MLEAYSTNIAVSADTALPYNSTSLIKGCTVTHPSADTINLNKCGIYCVSCSASADASTTIQLYKDGVAQPQAQSTGEVLSFTTLVQADKNNSNCACASPTQLQVMNTTETTLIDCNITVTKLA